MRDHFEMILDKVVLEDSILYEWILITHTFTTFFPDLDRFLIDSWQLVLGRVPGSEKNQPRSGEIIK